MSKISNIKIENNTIRREWDEVSKSWQFSIVDIITILDVSKDPRNYWKVLKNRLRVANKELVTKCNQLKLPSSDGKSYMTDTADAETLLELIVMISPSEVTKFRLWFDTIEALPTLHSKSLEETEADMGADLLVDAYETDKEIIIISLVAGVAIEDILISVTCDSITIKGKRVTGRFNENTNQNIEELYWGIFSRTIPLPQEVDIDEVRATTEHGLLTVALPKKDKFRTRIIKVKSL